MERKKSNHFHIPPLPDYKLKLNGKTIILSVTYNNSNIRFLLTMPKKPFIVPYENTYSLEIIKKMNKSFSEIDTPKKFIELLDSLYKNKKLCLVFDPNIPKMIQVVCKLPVLFKEDAVIFELAPSSNKNYLNLEKCMTKENIRILLVGERKVGKTAYMKRLLGIIYPGEDIKDKILVKKERGLSFNSEGKNGEANNNMDTHMNLNSSSEKNVDETDLTGYLKSAAENDNDENENNNNENKNNNSTENKINEANEDNKNIDTDENKDKENLENTINLNENDSNKNNNKSDNNSNNKTENNNPQEEIIEEYIPTEGFTFSKIEAKKNTREFFVELIDIEGDKSNLDLIQKCCKKADGCIIISDLEKPEKKDE